MDIGVKSHKQDKRQTMRKYLPDPPMIQDVNTKQRKDPPNQINGQQ